MFEIGYGEEGTVLVKGRLDAAQAPRAQEFLDQVTGHCVLDIGGLEYISSAGLGVLLRTHKRFVGDGTGLKLTNVNSHINDIFNYSGFNKLFDIEVADA